MMMVMITMMMVMITLMMILNEHRLKALTQRRSENICAVATAKQNTKETFVLYLVLYHLYHICIGCLYLNEYRFLKANTRLRGFVDELACLQLACSTVCKYLCENNLCVNICVKIFVWKYLCEKICTANCGWVSMPCLARARFHNVFHCGLDLVCFTWWSLTLCFALCVSLSVFCLLDGVTPWI